MSSAIAELHGQKTATALVRIGFVPLVVSALLIQFVLVLPHNSFADMADPEMSFPAMLTKAFGPYEAGVILGGFGQASKSQWSELLVNRPDLSLIPAP